jgi:hypothetical protein
MEELQMRLLRKLSCYALLLVALLVLPAEGAEPARVLLRTRAAADGTVQVMATVVDARGAPVAEVPLVFKRRTAFGWLTLLETSTGKDGTAQTTLGAEAAPGEIAVEAGEDGTIRAAVLVERRKAPPPVIRPGRDVLRGLSPQPGFISPYPVPLQVTLFGVILGGIWATYGYVAWLLLRIRREGDHPGRPL